MEVILVISKIKITWPGRVTRPFPETARALGLTAPPGFRSPDTAWEQGGGKAEVARIAQVASAEKREAREAEAQVGCRGRRRTAPTAHSSSQGLSIYPGDMLFFSKFSVGTRKRKKVSWHWF